MPKQRKLKMSWLYIIIKYPRLGKKLSNFISKIKITNSLHQTSKDTTDGTNTKYERINDVPTANIKHILKHNISIPPNNTTTYWQSINIGYNIKYKSHRTSTCHNITTIDTKNNTAIQKKLSNIAIAIHQ